MNNIYIPIVIAPHDIALCKYYLEAQDNLGYLQVLDARIALLHAVTTPYQEHELKVFLYDIACVLPITFLEASSQCMHRRIS